MKNASLLKHADWIWPSGIYADCRNAYADFRYDFQVKRNRKPARLAITADQSYLLYFNGKYVGRGPARGYQWSWPYDEYDLGKYARPGHNWISVRAYNPGCSTFQYLHQAACGMICAGEICGKQILSGEGWVGRISTGNRRDTAKLSIQLNYQEWMDVRVDGQEWIRSGRRPCSWKTPLSRRPYGHMPWHSLEPRGIPNLSNNVLAYRRVVAQGAGRCDAQYKTDPNLTLPWFRERKSLKWERVDESDGGAAGLKIPATGNGNLKAIVFDLGRPTIGTLIAYVNGAGGGEILDFFFFEVFAANGFPALEDPRDGCAMAMSARLILRKGKTRHEFFQMIGHRYLAMIVRDTQRRLQFQLHLRETVYPMQIKGAFKSGDRAANDIYKICMQTQRVCSLDSYVDTPWREQAQWWGDARVQAQSTFHLSADFRLLARGIRSIARQEVPNGLTYGHAPTVAHTCILPDFALTWILTIWDYYYQTGEIGLFKEQFGRIARVLHYFRTEGQSQNGLLRFDRRYWLFLDWSDLYREGNPALLNLWYVLALEKLAELARLAGMRRQQAELAKEYRAHCRKVIAAFWDEKEKMFCDGLAENGKRVGRYSIHTQTLAILCGLHASRQNAIIEQCLLPYVHGNEIPGTKPSSYWVTYVYEVLKRSGYGMDVVRHIREKWMPMIPYGGTWETFDMQFGAHSVTHAWSAHPLYHLAGTLGGILQNEVGWKNILYQPVIMPEYRFAEVVVPTPQGTIRAGWKVKGEKVEVKLALPAGVQAAVRLPGVRDQITGQIKWSLGLPARTALGRTAS
ncbi:MAG: alpha-L-rhamnosidase C-terminal domain-containing protein [Kiritimatiellae bacterium]|nr:alpha-L-rhamnosidase C-terminal domain-containing protein [Kiritimatiellia bacterium]